MSDHDDQIDALSYAIHPWQAEVIKRIASETLRDQAERIVADAKSKVPLYLGHTRGSGKTAVMYHILGSKPYGEVGVVLGRGSYPAGSPTSRTKVMSLGTGKVLVLDGPEAGRIK